MSKKPELKEKFVKAYFKYLTFFTIGSLVGCVFETIVAFIKKGYWVSRQGLIYGPFIPVYGAGIVLAVLFLEKFRRKDKKLPIFVLGGVFCGIAEYIFSYVQEIIFHTYSWDYSKYPLDINGRTTVIHMVIWGILILLFMQFVYPIIMKLIEKVNSKVKCWLIVVFTIFFALNITISSLACNREYERYKNIPADSKLDILLDKYYDDEFLKKIYPNKRYKK